jgi:hypothetical protein
MAKALSEDDVRQAARMYAEGSSVEEIGAWLGCGSRTVLGHLQRLGAIPGRESLSEEDAARREIAADRRLAKALALLEERYRVSLRRREG